MSHSDISEQMMYRPQLLVNWPTKFLVMRGGALPIV